MDRNIAGAVCRGLEEEVASVPGQVSEEDAEVDEEFTERGGEAAHVRWGHLGCVQLGPHERDTGAHTCSQRGRDAERHSEGETVRDTQ